MYLLDFSFISLQALIRYALAPPVYTCLSVCLCINTTAKIQQERDQPDAEEESRAEQQHRTAQPGINRYFSPSAIDQGR
jgi:hypothetical protein